MGLCTAPVPRGAECLRPVRGYSRARGLEGQALAGQAAGCSGHPAAGACKSSAVPLASALIGCISTVTHFPDTPLSVFFSVCALLK